MSGEEVKATVYEDLEFVEQDEDVKVEKDEQKVTPAKEQPKNTIEQSVVEEDEVPAAEQEARSEGWRPKDEWDGDPEDWVDYKEFNFRGRLMKRIQQQSTLLSNVQKENKEVKEALRALGEHNKKIAEKEYNRALKDLKNRRLEALEEGEHRQALELEEQMEDLKQSKQELDNEFKAETKSEESDQNAPPKEVIEWLQDDANKWYHEDPIMKGAADAAFVAYMNDNPNDFVGALEYAGKVMQKRFPTEMGVQKKPTKGAITEPDGRSNVGRRQARKKFTPRDLTEEQQSVARTFVSQGVFKNVQEYVDQLVETGELG